jgi:hypothetical protein
MYYLEGLNENLIYLANPRTGSSAVAQALVEAGAERIDGHHGSEGLMELIAETNPVIAFNVRNHFEVIVSYWAKKASGWTFSEFLDMVLAGDHPRFPKGNLYNNWEIPYDYTKIMPLRHEALDAEYVNLASIVGMDAHRLPLTQNSGYHSNRYMDEYSSAMVEAVMDVYGEEMEVLGYDGRR